MKLTKKERALCDLLGVKYVSRDPEPGAAAILWKDKPTMSRAGYCFDGTEIGAVDPPLFRSLKQGTMACVAEAEG